MRLELERAALDDVDRLDRFDDVEDGHLAFGVADRETAIAATLRSHELGANQLLHDLREIADRNLRGLADHLGGEALALVVDEEDGRA